MLASLESEEIRALHRALEKIEQRIGTPSLRRKALGALEMVDGAAEVLEQ
jgi:hypothetical protein